MGFADMARKILREAEKAGDSSPAPPCLTGRQGAYLESDGSLVIPLDSGPRYHWWAGGQSVAETMWEISEGRERS